MKKLVLSFFLMLAATIAFGQKNMIDGVVWIVGEDAILYSDVEQVKTEALHNGMNLDKEAICKVVEQMAVQKLFLHQASLDSINANDARVESILNMEISRIVSEIGSQEKLEEYLKKTISEIKDDMRQRIRNQMITSEVQQKIVGKQKISPSDVRFFYEKLNQDSIPTVPATVETQIIKLEPKISDTEKEKVKNQLRELAERVNSGRADFATLARLYSEDEGSASQGGDLGFFGKGMMEPEFSNVAFALQEKGKVSRVIETMYGFHIIQLVEKKGDRINCRHILMRPKISTELKQLTLNRLDSISNLIKAKNMTFEQAVASFSSDKDTRLNGGLVANQNTGEARLEYQDLPSDIARNVYDLEKDDISKPFAMMDTRLGREVFAIVKAKNKYPSHKANIQDDYQRLKLLYENTQREKLLKSWIQNKIKSTYIFVSPEWSNCKFDFEGWTK